MSIDIIGNRGIDSRALADKKMCLALKENMDGILNFDCNPLFKGLSVMQIAYLVPSVEVISGNIGRTATFPPKQDARIIRPIASNYHLSHALTERALRWNRTNYLLVVFCIKLREGLKVE